MNARIGSGRLDGIAIQRRIIGLHVRHRQAAIEQSCNAVDLDVGALQHSLAIVAEGYLAGQLGQFGGAFVDFADKISDRDTDSTDPGVTMCACMQVLCPMMAS